MKTKQDADQQLVEFVEQARAGDRAALDRVVQAIQDSVYGLALRMLGVPAEAEDASQEILVKVVTRLDSFRGESRFTTWVYAVAASHLRTVMASAWNRRYESFEGQSFDQMIQRQAEILQRARQLDLSSALKGRTTRSHQGLGHRLLEPDETAGRSEGPVACRKRVGGMLRYYHREAA